MLAWTRQGPAFAADFTLLDGRHAKTVLVAARSNPKGLAVIIPSEDGSIQTLLSPAEFSLIPAGDYIEILLMQERVFGTSELPAPEVAV